MVRRPYVSVATLLILGVLALTLLPLVPTAPGAAANGTNSIQIVSRSPSEIVLELTTDRYNITTLSPTADGTPTAPWQSRINIDGLAQTNDPGLPQLPVVHALLGVPPNAQVSLTVLSGAGTPLAASVALAPAAVPVPLATGDNPDARPGVAPVTYQRDPAVYASNDLLPATNATISEDAFLRDQRVVRVAIAPMQYRAASQQVLWQQQVRVAVRFSYPTDAPSSGNPPAFTPSPFEGTLATSLLNYQQTVDNNWRTPPHTNAAPTLDVPASTGTRYRITTTEAGLHSITPADLQAAGLDTASLDPRKLHLSHRGEDVAMLVTGESDGSFDSNDRIIFYAAAFTGEGDTLPERASEERYMQGKNVYWLAVKSSNGTRVSSRAAAPNGGTTPTSFRDTVRAEVSHYWSITQFSNPDTWYWARITANGQFVNCDVGSDCSTSTSPLTWNEPFGITLPDPVTSAGSTATVRGAMMSESFSSTAYPDFLFSLRFGGTNGLDGVDIVTNAPWDSFDQVGDNRYYQYANRRWYNPPVTASRASEFLFTGTITQNNLSNGNNPFSIAVQSNTGAAVRTHLNWLEVEYDRQFRATDNQLLFSMPAGTYTYAVSNLSSSSRYLFDISDPAQPVNLTGSTFAGNTVSFGATQSDTATYAIASTPGMYSPASITASNPADLLAGSNGADYIVIAPDEFLSTAQRLTDYRATQSIRTKLVRLRDVYDLFYDGFPHPHAVREFLAYATANWVSPAPAAVVLVGDGHWNFPDSTRYTRRSDSQYFPPNMEWVDPFQGEVDSSNQLVTIVGDDVLPDLLIGRMAVNSTAELNAMIDKLIAYESQPDAAWHERVILIADENDPAAGNFPNDTDNLSEQHMPADLTRERVFVEDYGCGGGITSTCPLVNDDIVTAINTNGAQYINYAGHGAANRWTKRSVFTPGDVERLTNNEALPIVISMTCLDGEWQHPGITGTSNAVYEGIAELLVRADDKGAIATFSSTGLGLATGHDILMGGFYDAAFGNARTVGQAAMNARLRVFASGGFFDLIDSYGIYGDPLLNLIGTEAVSLTTSDSPGAPGSVFAFDGSALPPNTPFDVKVRLPGSNNWVPFGSATSDSNGNVRVGLYILPNATNGTYEVQFATTQDAILGVSAWYGTFAVSSSAPLRNPDLVPTATPTATNTAAPPPTATPDPSRTATSTPTPTATQPGQVVDVPTPTITPTAGQPGTTDGKVYLPMTVR